jgi:hypothetical protein
VRPSTFQNAVTAVDAAAQEGRRRREADVDPADAPRVAAAAADDGVEDRVVAGQAGDPGPAALERGGERMPGRARTAASGRWTMAMTPTRSAPCSRARARS